jgi:outer membrane protein assembly factor BamB
MRHLMPLPAVVVLGSLLSAADWPHWRGPSRNGQTPELSGWANGRWLPDQPAWSVRVGAGASSPLVIGDRVYALGRSAGQDALRCLKADDGSELWIAKYPGPVYGRFHSGDEGHYSGPSSTPEYDPTTQLIYTLGPDGDLRCWDTTADGREVWGLNLYDAYGVKQRPRLTRAGLRDYGYTSSPLVYRDWLLVEVGSARGTIIAFDKKTGKEVWASQLTDEAGHTGGPALMTVEGVPCLAVVTLRHLAVIRLDRGHEGQTAAAVPWVTDFANTIASPAVQDNYVLVTAAYNHYALCKFRVTLTGAEELWRVRYPSKVCTPVIHGGHVYLAWQRVRCLDWETGEQRWEGGAFGDAGSCIVTADERLVVYGGHGKLALIETARRSPTAYTELAVRERIFTTAAWPHGVLAGGRLYCRDRDGNMVCFVVGR